MSAALIIRPLAAADRAAWLALWRGYQRFYEADIPDAVSDLTFARLLNPAEPMTALVAERDGVLVGLAHCVQHRSTWTGGDYLYLQDLFVAPAARDAGAGRALIAAAYALADARGCSRVHWLTHETNAGARALYDAVATRSGFVQYRRG